MKILLLSDTHSYIDDRILHYANEADEAVKPLRGVYGNIDGTDVRQYFPKVNRFQCEQVEVLMIHIGGYPNKYTPLAKQEILAHSPKLFISGHSHILKVQYDPQFQLLHLNPGAAGIYGWQTVRTMLRFEIQGKEIKNLEIIELAKR